MQNFFVRTGKADGTALIPSDNEKNDWDEEKLIPLEVKKGTLVLLHGSVVHASSLNRSERSRHVFVLHLADLACEWQEENWLQRPADMPFKSMREELISC